MFFYGCLTGTVQAKRFAASYARMGYILYAMISKIYPGHSRVDENNQTPAERRSHHYPSNICNEKQGLQATKANICNATNTTLSQPSFKSRFRRHLDPLKRNPPTNNRIGTPETPVINAKAQVIVPQPAVSRMKPAKKGPATLPAA